MYLLHFFHRPEGINYGAMISIKNKEAEECQVKLVDIGGKVHYETRLKPQSSLDIDLGAFARGIYFLIFYTTSTSFIQELIKY
ncbi:MAG: T9SS type A sorting domain-containing protein [Sphingobacteriales bacterium]|nr:MAG: T9SS type A sorting domain-containing protein [Sphingobacteriales bacterium]